MKFKFSTGLDGKPGTIACMACAAFINLVVAKPSLFSYIGGAAALILLVLNIYSWDYQNRHGWPLDDNE